MTVIHVAAVFLLGAFFVGCALSNASVLYMYYVKKKTGSQIPIIGALSGMFAVLLLPVEGARVLWWVPWVLDPGGLPWLILVSYAYLKDRIAHREKSKGPEA